MNIEKPIRIYQCEDSVDGVFSAVYEAGISGYGHKFIKIQIIKEDEPQELELFSEYITVTTDSHKSESVARAVRDKISFQAYVYIMYAAASAFSDRGDAIYQFVTYGFTMGKKVCGALQLPCVKRIFEMKRAVSNESHYSREFLRFQEIRKNPSLLIALFEPIHRVLPFITEHFSDRLPDDWFIIVDKTHHEASFHNASGEWEIHLLTSEEEQRLDEMTEHQEEYVDLWKTFFQNIAITERKNEKLQKNNMPLHYRKYVTEWQ